MKKNKLYIFSFIFVILSLCLGVGFLNTDNNVAMAASSLQTFDQTIKNISYGETVTVNNTLIFINFQGETNTLHNTHSRYEKKLYEVIEDTYNYSEYSVKNYFEVTSNQKLSLQTNILYNGTEGTPFTLSYDREYFLTGDGSKNPVLLTNSIWTTISTAFNSYAKNYNLDANGDGYIDSITFLLCPDPENRDVEWSSALWAHSSQFIVSSTIVDASGKNLKLGKYNLADATLDVYSGDTLINRDPLVDSNGIQIAESSTFAHELSHVLGLPDYYIYDTLYPDYTLSDYDEVPVGLWDLMAYNYYQMPQHSLAYNKMLMGYIEESNVVEVTENNVYELYPTSYWEDHQITENDVVAYYIRGQGDYTDQYFYIEYRKNYGLFDSMLPTSGLVVYRVDTNVETLTYSGVSSGNYMAPPYNIQVMRNEVSSSSSEYLRTFGQAYLKAYTSNEGRNYSYYTLSNKGMAGSVATGLDGVGLTKIGNALNSSATAGTTQINVGTSSANLNWTTGDITYQVYSGSNQILISPENVSYENTGITIEALNITSDGKITFQIDWDNLPDPVVEENNLINSSEFEDINLYNKLLELLSDYRGTTVTELYTNDFKTFTILDLSNSNISSLVGLEKFNFQNLNIINLMQNDLTNTSLNLLNTLVSNYSNIEYINLNINSLELQTIPNEIESNTKFIFGFQNYNGALNKTEYYFSTDAQTNILSYYFNDDSILQTSYGTNFVDIYNNTTTPNYYEFNVRFKNSNIGSNFTIKFYIIKIVANSVTIERNSAFTEGIVVNGINKNLLTITTLSPVSTISEVQNAHVTYKVAIKNESSIYRTFTSTYTIVDTTAPTLTSSLSNQTQNILIGEKFDIKNISYNIIDNGKAETTYTLKYGMVSETDRKVVAYKIEKLSDGVWTQVSDINTSKINEEYRIILQAVDNSGNKSEEVVINYVIVPTSILQASDFASQTLYNALLNIAYTKDSQILYPEVFAGINYIDISNLNLSSLSGLEKFYFDNNTIIDASNNKLDSTNSFSDFINSDVIIFLLFNNITEKTGADNFVYGIQNLKTKYINEMPVLGTNLFIEEDYLNYFDYTITKDVSSSFGMSMLDMQTTPFTEYGTYKITFTYKNNTNITHSAKIQYGRIELRNQTYSQEAGLPFSRDDIVFEGLDNSDYYFEIKGVPNGNLNIGEFVATYEIYQNSNQEKILTLTQTVNVSDTMAPTISLIGRQEIYIYLGSTYLDQGVRASDSYDSNPAVITTGEVNTSNVGKYYITYKAQDASGNQSNVKTRIVNVIYYPIQGINVDVETSFYTGETAVFNVSPIAPEDKMEYINPNLEYSVYVNGEKLETNKFNYKFDKAGTYKLEVKAQTTDSTGNLRIVSSDTYTIVVKDKTFIESYGAYILAGMAIFIVASIIIYFVCSNRRDKII